MDNIYSKNPQLSIIQGQMPPETEEVKHYHVESEQFFFVLSGKIAIEINDKVHTLDTKEGIHVPVQQAHQVKNIFDKDTEFLVISAPPSHGDRTPVS